MKKILSVVLAAFSILFLFSSCSDNKDKPSAHEAADAQAVFAEMSEKYADRGHPIAVIVMEDGGTIALELYEDVAPNTVNNFIQLANSGFYNGTIFHRVIPGFMIQGGDPDGTGMGGPGYQIFGEFSNNEFKNELKHERGVISMARQGNQFYPALAYNTAGSQFFIMVEDKAGLDGDYAAFGRVLEGMEVADKIVSAPRNSSDKPLEEQKMQLVKVQLYDKTYPEPETIAE